MQLGIFSGASGSLLDPSELAVDAARASDAGFGSYWIPQLPWGPDALIALAVAGSAVPEMELGTAVIPVYTRHPITMAQQAATTALTLGEGRLALGIGMSHKPVVEGQFGIPFERPIRYLREYLEIMTPLLRNEKVSFRGEMMTGRASHMLADAPVPSVLIAALGPQMLRLAGKMADGTITWMTGNATLAELTVPTIRGAAEEAGRAQPRVLVGLPIMCTDDVEAGRALGAKLFEIYGKLPSYRAMLDREGLAGPEDFCIIGDESMIEERLAAVFDAGADTVICAEFGSTEDLARTRAALSALT